MSLWITENVYDSCAKEFRDCRKYGNIGTKLCCWRSDRRGGGNLENGYGTCGDNKTNQELLLDTMSKSTESGKQ